MEQYDSSAISLRADHLPCGALLGGERLAGRAGGREGPSKEVAQPFLYFLFLITFPFLFFFIFYLRLPNLVSNTRVDDDGYTHLDFLWAMHNRRLLYQPTLELMKQYP